MNNILNNNNNYYRYSIRAVALYACTLSSSLYAYIERKSLLTSFTVVKCSVINVIAVFRLFSVLHSVHGRA